MFVQMSDVSALVRANCFRADRVANGLLLTVDLAECTIGIPLPVDLVTVDLIKE